LSYEAVNIDIVSLRFKQSSITITMLMWRQLQKCVSRNQEVKERKALQ